MVDAASEPISPELVLVCPELAAAARAALPEPWVPVAVAPQQSPLWVLALAYGGMRLLALAVGSVVWILLLALIATAPLLF